MLNTVENIVAKEEIAPHEHNAVKSHLLLLRQNVSACGKGLTCPTYNLNLLNVLQTTINFPLVDISLMVIICPTLQCFQRYSIIQIIFLFHHTKCPMLEIMIYSFSYCCYFL